MSYKLYLDDERQPVLSFKLMEKRIGKEAIRYVTGEWVVVKHYFAFCDYIEKNGLPELVSFDHDLAEGHYHKNMQEGVINYDSEDFKTNHFKTGYHCAKWLKEYCEERDLNFPPYYVHSMNPVGVENILALLEKVKQ